MQANHFQKIEELGRISSRLLSIGKIKHIIIINDSMTSVFNTNALLPYNHDLFESVIVKKRIKLYHAFGAWLPSQQKEASRLGYWRVAEALTRAVETLRLGSNHGPSGPLSNKSWLYGSEASVLSTDVRLSLMMMMMLADRIFCCAIH
ncbi:hypothetical protein T265_06422 [Opisthorchis viverrini]|uniref:Uncharacterized protein n=1 Tax=Opisthorchis viverrini TaxID=6198 RepID=A0A075ADV2_OPIVI|nr:hypothetical protein T265_06422 [Opisthorchis viverrini]KER26304.1 hypothetical protein T265_06422 [Opisthorchis viverrini]